MRTVYLDNAATSFPKPAGVSDRMKYYMDAVGATINRSVYGSAQSAGLVTLHLREQLKTLFHFPEKATHVILTPGNTASLNFIIRGFLQPGDHCLVSAMEHNAVMRPLSESAGITFDRVPCDETGRMDVGAIPGLIRENTRLFILAHASNVSGTLQDAAAVGQICASCRIPFVLDAAQTAGHLPVDFSALGLSALCAPGHKGLLGPSGIGVLLLTDDFSKQLRPLIAGGTGSASDSEFLPDFLPDRFESGTPNLPGIYGLDAAVEFLLNTGTDAVRAHDTLLSKRFIDGISGINNVRLVGPVCPAERVGVLSVDFLNRDNAEAAFLLEQEYGILTRCGLHCAPSAHKTLGTFPRGTIRFSVGLFNTEADIDAAVNAVRELAAE